MLVADSSPLSVFKINKISYANDLLWTRVLAVDAGLDTEPNSSGEEVKITIDRDLSMYVDPA